MLLLGWLALRTAVPSKGTLVVESADPAAEVVIRRDGKEVYRGGGGEVPLPAGDGYTVELAEPKPTLRLTTTRFALAGGGRETVRVEFRAKPRPREEPVAAVAPPSTSGGIDLLRLIDPAKDTVKGVWERKGNDLVGEGRDTHAVIEVPYRPAEEYDYLVEFTRTSGAGDVSLALSKGGQSFKFGIGVHYVNFGFEIVNGVGANAAYPDRILVNGRRYRARWRSARTA